MCAGGKEVPVLVYNPSDNSSKFHYIENQSLKWQGQYCIRLSSLELEQQVFEYSD